MASKDDVVSGVTFSTEKLTHSVEGMSVTAKVGVGTMVPGGYSERAGHGRAHVIRNLSDEPAKIRRTTTRPGSAPEVEEIELKREQPIWIDPTPEGVTVRVENVGGGTFIFGKLWPHDQ